MDPQHRAQKSPTDLGSCHLLRRLSQYFQKSQVKDTGTHNLRTFLSSNPMLLRLLDGHVLSNYLTHIEIGMFTSLP